MTNSSQSPTPLDYQPPQACQPRPHGFGLLLSVIGIATLFCFIGNVLPLGAMRHRPQSNRIRCASNLRQIGQAIQMYANEHGGAYPPDFGTLILKEPISSDVFCCPSSNDVRAIGSEEQVARQFAASAPPGTGGCLSYLYFGAKLTAASPADCIVALEPSTIHADQGGNVLYSDGHVEWYDAKILTKILAELNTGRNPPRPEKLK